jgi:hypothetical protein
VTPWTPARRRGEERIDDPALDPGVLVRSLEDVARSNALFGGRRAVLAALAPALGPAGSALTLLDVGTGSATSRGGPARSPSGAGCASRPWAWS